MSLSLAEQLRNKKQAVEDRKAGQQRTYTFKQPSTRLRILPTWRDADHENPTFFHDFGMTWVKDMDGKIMAVVGDRKITFGEDDLVRNLVGQAIGGSKTDAQREHFKEMLASPRVLVNALVLDDKNVDADVPQIVEFSESQFAGPISDLMIAAADEGDNILDLEKGFDLTVNKTGSGKEGTKYTFTLSRKSTPVDPAVMEKVNDIDAFIRAKFADGERAVNAIKSLTGTPLALTSRSSDAGDRKIESHVEAEYSVVEEASEDATEVTNTPATDAEIEALFD